jgi:hypothetical protein
VSDALRDVANALQSLRRSVWLAQETKGYSSRSHLSKRLMEFGATAARGGLSICAHRLCCNARVWQNVGVTIIERWTISVRHGRKATREPNIFVQNNMRVSLDHLNALVYEPTVVFPRHELLAAPVAHRNNAGRRFATSECIFRVAVRAANNLTLSMKARSARLQHFCSVLRIATLVIRLPCVVQ